MQVELPLLEQAGQHAFTLLVKDRSGLIPASKPAPGEQYRFHFDMSKCIGCKCCMVACNEQNGNPADINWRRVGEVEGGVFPIAQRWHLSMGCNHCLEPSCMSGCPVEAYTKDPVTGVVDHDPDVCIGCQYCTWNCSYGVPQFNAERGVVGKCDLCHSRLNQDLAPACVDACPETAITVEIVNQAAWRKEHASADAPGMPSAEDSFSTTRITMPAKAVDGLARVDTLRVQPEDPHWPLVFLLVFTQLSIGAFAALWLMDVVGAPVAALAGIVPLAVGVIALASAPLHLGRPAFAWRAMRNWKRSWLSREILGLSVFAGAATAYTAAIFLQMAGREWFGLAAVIAGLGAVMCSARIYMVPARPAWNLAYSMTAFQLTGAVLGPRVLLALGDSSQGWMVALAGAATCAQMINSLMRDRAMAGSGVHELRSSALLARTSLAKTQRAGIVLNILSLIVLAWSPLASLAFALAAEIAARYLFFTSVVPKGIASTFLTPKRSAA
ncbi:MAG: dimethyl sulfoxide reductase anchor subunit [Bryobacterales bacterium]|nr:dimethyl sulfoxide reductase anchor subunit [Bryobacterales bacterium]